MTINMIELHAQARAIVGRISEMLDSLSDDDLSREQLEGQLASALEDEADCFRLLPVKAAA